MAEAYEELLEENQHAPSVTATLPPTVQDLSGVADDMMFAAAGYLLPGLVSELFFGGDKKERRDKFLERFKSEKNKYKKAAKAQMWVSIGTFLATYVGTQWVADREYAMTGDVPRTGLKGILWKKRPQLVLGAAVRAIRDILDATLDIDADKDSWSSKLRRIMTLTPPKGKIDNSSVFLEIIEEDVSKEKGTEGIFGVGATDTEPLLPLDMKLPPEYEPVVIEEKRTLPEQLSPTEQLSPKTQDKKTKTKLNKSIIKDYYAVLNLR